MFSEIAQSIPVGATNSNIPWDNIVTGVAAIVAAGIGGWLAIVAASLSRRYAHEQFEKQMREERRRLQLAHVQQVYDRFVRELSNVFPQYSDDISISEFQNVYLSVIRTYSSASVYLDDTISDVFNKQIRDGTMELMKLAKDESPHEAILELEKRVDLVRTAVRNSIVRMEKEALDGES
jgi:hypothetical protein